MGFTPVQVDDMTPWEFSCCLDGYIEANSPDEGKDRGGDLGTMSYDEFKEFMAS